MRSLRLTVIVTAAALLSFVAVRPAWPADAAALSRAVQSIRSEDLDDHVTTLAADRLEGREAGSRGGRRAGDYLVERLQDLGVKPAGIDGGYYQPFGNGYRNVIARIPGGDGNLKNEIILLGGHYDHVGYGTPYNSLGPTGRIHNGADDNASGVAALLEVAEALASTGLEPERSIVFVFWDAEEKGLLGSQHWMDEPTVPIEDVKLAFNLDMVGRLRRRGMTVFGTRTGAGLRRMISLQNRGIGLRLDFDPGIDANSDHYPLVRRDVPFLMLHTGKHGNYHRPSDDPDTINLSGLQRISRLVFKTAWAAADRETLPDFRDAALEEAWDSLMSSGRRDPGPTRRLGVAWDSESAEKGTIRLTRIFEGSPAEEAGLQSGDRILRFDGYPADAVDDFRLLVLAAENPVPVLVEREGEEKPVELTVRLRGDALRVGIHWRTDEAEPNSVILTRVVPGSPADHAGLQAGARLYRVNGRDFSSNEEFKELITAERESLRLTVEHQGRVREAVLKFPLQDMQEDQKQDE